MLLVVEWCFNDLQHNLQMTVSLEVIFLFLDGNTKFSTRRFLSFQELCFPALRLLVRCSPPSCKHNAERHDARR